MSIYTSTHVNNFDPDAVPPQSVKEFFNGRKIFITGGSGFLGKALVEKLLRSCSNLDTIYLLVRLKKGKDPHGRLKLITDNGLFDRLKQEYPNAISKLQVVAGDVTQKGLGLSDADRRTLEDNVSVVFHSAASVRFDDPLKDAIIMNVRGTLEVVKLASCMKQLEVMVHISTTYCNLDQQVVPECVLPSHGNWRTFLEAAETMDSMTLNILTKKFLSFHPNTYTFTKSLAEQIINDYRDKISVAIVRPSVVVPSLYDPIPGWIDNMNGPISINIASGKGILHAICMNGDGAINYIPVDLVTKAVILSAWQRAFQKSIHNVPVYNAAAHSDYLITQMENTEAAWCATRENPLNGAVYYPWVYITKQMWIFYLLFFLVQIPQALILDIALRLAGKKAMLLKIQRKIFDALLSLQIFLQNEWIFPTDNFLGLEKILHTEEKEEFGYHHSRFIIYDYYVNSIVGLTKFLFNEEHTLKKNQQHQKRLYIGHCILCTLIVAVLGWMLHTFQLHLLIFTKLANVIRLFIQV